MRLLRNAALLAFAGLVIGAIHSYCAPINLRPANNPEPPPVEPRPEAAAPPEGTRPADPGTPPEQTAQAKQPDPPKPPVAEQPNYYIDLDRAKQLFDRAQAQHDVYFIDARPEKDYLAAHVQGAMHLPPAAVAGRPPQKVDFLPGMVVVVYCHGATCTDSESVMIRLQNLKRDIGPIYILRDGFDPWKARGWPTESGPDQNG